MPVKRHTKSRAPHRERHKLTPKRSIYELSYHAELVRLLDLRSSGAAAASRSVVRSGRHVDTQADLAHVFDLGE
jgi:hypothetical protein